MDWKEAFRRANLEPISQFQFHSCTDLDRATEVAPALSLTDIESAVSNEQVDEVPGKYRQQGETAHANL